MSTFEKISPDDPRLTAFALGEMEPAERAEFEQLLKQDAAARALVAELNGTAQSIGAALAGEPLPAAVPQNIAPALAPAAIIPGRNRRQYDGGPLLAGETPNLQRGWGKLLRFPSLYFTISGLAAACFAVAFLLWGPGTNPPEQAHYTEIDLSKIGPAEVGLAELAEESFPPSGGASHPTGSGGRDFVRVQSEPLSTFAPVVDTAAFAKVQQQISRGKWPAQVPIEALVNYFPYHYATPDQRGGQSAEAAGWVTEDNIFAAHLEVADAPWAPEHRLVRIGLKGREEREAGRKSSAIARDMSVQVAFNPAQVLAYRLIGYESRSESLAHSSLDPVVAPAIKSGHAMTALYEIVLNGGSGKANPPGLLGYSPEIMAQGRPGSALGEELLTVQLRYTLPMGEIRRVAEFPLRDAGRTFEQASPDFKFAASVAAFGMILRESPHKGAATFASVTHWAQAGLVDDTGGYRSAFVGLVNEAARLRN